MRLWAIQSLRQKNIQSTVVKNSVNKEMTMSPIADAIETKTQLAVVKGKCNRTIEFEKFFVYKNMYLIFSLPRS